MSERTVCNVCGGYQSGHYARDHTFYPSDSMRNTVAGHTTLIKLNHASLISLTEKKPELRTVEVEEALGLLRGALLRLDAASRALDEWGWYTEVRDE